jgi:hypothetical protein
MPPGGAIYAALLIFQACAASALLIVVSALKIRTLKQDREGGRGLLLWVGFAFALLALSLDWLALAASHFSKQPQIDLWRDAMLATGLAAVLAASFGKGSGKVLLIVTALALIIASRMLTFAFLLQS